MYFGIMSRIDGRGAMVNYWRFRSMAILVNGRAHLITVLFAERYISGWNRPLAGRFWRPAKISPGRLGGTPNQTGLRPISVNLIPCQEMNCWYDGPMTNIDS